MYVKKKVQKCFLNLRSKFYWTFLKTNKRALLDFPEWLEV